jgi:hypothetical protein
MASQPHVLHIAAAIATTRSGAPHPSITTRVTQAADAFAKAFPSRTSPRPLAYARSEGECCK